eukprot:SAG25_NODE_380_length_8808_cov_3.861523_7_plen_81_part_00
MAQRLAFMLAAIDDPAVSTDIFRQELEQAIFDDRILALQATGVDFDAQYYVAGGVICESIESWVQFPGSITSSSQPLLCM